MIPISDSTHARSFPYVNVAIIAINIVLFLYEIALSNDAIRGSIDGIRLASALDRFIWHWGNIPSCTLDALGIAHNIPRGGAPICQAQPHPALTILSAMFLHGGWLHLLGNMLFLWIFGDNVEDAMGHAVYAVFYLVVGTLAAFTHMAFNANDLTPAIGASGAIAGVLGAYIVLFPRATVVALIPFILFIPIPVPAFILIGLFFVTELFTGISSLGPNAVGAGGGVAHFAHIGGFIAGALLVNVFVLDRLRAARQERRET